MRPTTARLWAALAAGSVGDRAGAEFAAFAQRALDAPTLEAVARGEAPVPRDPELIYFLGASCLARLASSSKEDGELAAKVIIALGGVSKEVAVWAVDAALSQKPASPAVAAFEVLLRTSGAQTLARCPAPQPLCPRRLICLRNPAASASGALDKIAAARVWLLKEKPFFGVLSRALTIDPRADERAFRLFADDRLAVNPLVVLRTPFPALAARLAHVALHAALGGFVRRGEREARRWNLAHDLAIDPLVRGAGLPLGLPPPPDELPPGSSAEDIFAVLPEGAAPGDDWCDLSDVAARDEPPPDAPAGASAPPPVTSNVDEQTRALAWKMRLATAMQEERASGGKTWATSPRGLTR